MSAWALVFGLVMASVVAPQILSAQTAPTIATPPRSQSLYAGNNLILGAAVNGTAPFAYQWRSNGVAIAGQTNFLLAIFNSSTNHSGSYAVVVTNSFGSITSAVANITVNPLPANRVVVAWGDNRSGQTTVPAGLSGVTAIAGGERHTVALKSDGTVVAWGDNTDGQTNIPAGLNGVIAVAAGYLHTLALKNDGTVVGWGWNNFGQTTVPVAAQVGVVAIAAGYGHSVALKNDGSVVVWGRNAEGQTNVPAGLSGVLAIASGTFVTVALKTDGTLVGWGDNGNGQTTMPTGLNGVIAIAAGAEQTVALKDNGTVIAWGNNLYGPISVPVGLSGVRAIAAGVSHTMALKGDGTVVAWGAGKSNTGIDRNFGQSIVPDGLSGVTAIQGGYYHSLAVMSGPPAIRTQPQSLLVTNGVNLSLTVDAVGPGPLIYQWRSNNVTIANATNAVLAFTNAQTSFSANYDVITTNALGSIISSVATLTVLAPPAITAQPRSQTNYAGNNFILGAAVTGGALNYQWRSNGVAIAGQTNFLLAIFNSSTNRSGAYDVVVTNLVGSITSAVANITVNPLPTNLAVVGWGNVYPDDTYLPPSNYVAVVRSGPSLVALKSDGSIMTSGAGANGGVNVPAAATNIVAIAANDYYYGGCTIALRADGTVVAWGYSYYGQTTVPAGLSNVVAVSASPYIGLALKSDGTVTAWGAVDTNDLAGIAAFNNAVAIAWTWGNVLALKSDGTVMTSRPDAQLAGLTNVIALAGNSQVLALRSDGTVMGLGDNAYGQASVPGGLSNVIAVAAGDYHSLALKSDGTVVGWGAGTNGQSSPYPYAETQQATIPAGLTNVYSIAAGSGYSLALMRGPPALVYFSASPAYRDYQYQYLPQVVSAGGNATFNLRVAGSEPFGWQWRFNGAPLPGATGSWFHAALSLSNVSSANVGSYTIVVTNSFGSITSAPVTLTLNTGLPGSVDTTFVPGSGVGSQLTKVLVQPDGKIVVAGSYGSTNVARFNPDGSLDNTFNFVSIWDYVVDCIALQADGKMVIGGAFTNVNGFTRNRVARLNADGSVDASFDPGTGASGRVLAIAIQSDGKILLGGEYTNFNGVACNRLARLNPDGSLDIAFNPGAGIENFNTYGLPFIEALAVQPDGKLLIGGYFTRYNGVPRSGIARLLPDGRLDGSFTTAGSLFFINFPGVYSLAVQPDGKIVIGGQFTSVNDLSRNSIARLNPDGSLDTSFNPGTGASGNVAGLALQSDGRILICGNFTTINGIRRETIARLNYDGSLDNSFDTGSGILQNSSGQVASIALAADGRIYIAGYFYMVNGYSYRNVARLNSGPPAYPVISAASIGSGSTVRSPDITNYTYGQSVTLTAVPGRYYAFKKWSDGATNNLRAITIGTSNYFTAIFTNTVPLEWQVAKQWEGDFGGTNADTLTSLAPTGDGGYILGGYSYSGPSGNKGSGTFGGWDYWLVKLDANGSMQWETNYGGTSDDILYSLAQTSDGGFILGGSSYSIANGNKTSGNFGGRDYWVLKLDAGGRRQWETNYGGSGDDILHSLSPTGDGGYILGGYSDSVPSGNKTSGNFGGYDYWVVKIDANGSRQWEANCGGTSDDRLYSVAPASDGGYILGGYSFSGASGNKTTGTFGGDYWIVKLDAIGNKQWETNYGGNYGNFLTSLAPTSDGGYIVGGYSDSVVSGNKTSGNFGGYDYWVLKLDANGSKQWETNYGGTGDDYLYSVAPTLDGGYILGGYSNSGMSGNKTSGNLGGTDYWVVKLDANGRKHWESNYGGTNDDVLYSLAPTGGGGYILGGYSASSVSANKASGNFGGNDFWVLKLASTEAPVGTPIILVNGLIAPSNHHRIINTNAASISITSSIANAHIYYTLDGRDPDFGSIEYLGPFVVTGSAQLRVAAYDQNYYQAGVTVINFIDVIPNYTLTNTTPGGGTVLFDPPAGVYLSNSVITLSATAAPGWTFAGWSGDAAGTNNPISIAMNGNKTVKAVFATGLFSLPTPPTLGTVQIDPPGGSYAFGNNVTLMAVPNNRYYFSRWANTNYGSISPLMLTITNANVTNNALFATLSSNNVSLTVLVNGPGSVIKSPESPFYTNNAGIIVFANPDPGFVFTGWSGDATGTNNPLGVVLTTNKIITATFGLNVTNQPPSVTITNPPDGSVFTAPTNITINATAIDTNGTVTQVVFYAGTNLLALFTNAPYNFTWTNAPLGTNILTAIATDNGGLSATSAPVVVTVNVAPSGPPAFSLGSSTYFVIENAGSVTVTVLKSLNSVAGTVNYTTLNGSALAVSGGVGHYQAVSGSLSFTAGETNKTVTIPIIDNSVYTGNRDFTFALSLSSGNSSLANPNTATITIVEDDPPSTTNSFTEVLFPGAVPPHDGQLRVSIQPTNSSGQWRLVWETAWRNSGDIISGLPGGNYEVEFRPVLGFLAPNNTTNPVVAAQLTSITNQYTVNGTPQYGSLAVVLAPSSLINQVNVDLRAQWRLQGDTNWHDSGFRYTTLVAGNYLIEFKSLPDWVAPAPRVVLVAPDQDTSVSATYLVADTSSGTPPSVLQFSDATTPLSHQPPYPWTGQLLSDSGYGSGVVVKRRVVLTAAHVVFDDATLSYVTGVKWFFQREKGDYEPPAQIARGWYSFSGYAAARTNDNSPGVSSPASQSLDVAALYFLADAGRGGQSGYLVSEPGGMEWLQASAQKTLIGYPVEVVSEINRGRMHATLPGNLAFSPVTNRVFSTAGIRGYPGMSGGPLCVQFTNDTYYPAAVYLGGSAQTIVRAIDGAIADLINRADVTANTGANNTGGGVVLLSPGAGGSLFTPGNFQIMISPPEAVAAGAGWRITQLTNTSYFSDNSATYALPAAAYTLTFRPVFGFLTPGNRSLQVVANQTAVLTVNYTNLFPRAGAPALSNGAVNLTFTGPVGQRYALEWSTNLVNWQSLVTNTVATDGAVRFTDPNLANQPRTFYRARLVP